MDLRETLHMEKIPRPHPRPAAADAENGGGDGPDALYARCRVTLRPALAGRLGSMADAEDVLHEAFIRFLNSYSGRAIANPLGLLARIAMNVIRDIGRSERFRRTRLEGQANPVGMGPQPHSPEAICADQQGLRKAQEVIDRLPPRCREVFLLHRLDGLPHAEIAQILGISRSMVEKHLARADRQIRGELAEHVDIHSVRDA